MCIIMDEKLIKVSQGSNQGKHVETVLYCKSVALLHYLRFRPDPYMDCNTPYLMSTPYDTSVTLFLSCIFAVFKSFVQPQEFLHSNQIHETVRANRNQQPGVTLLAFQQSVKTCGETSMWAIQAMSLHSSPKSSHQHVVIFLCSVEKKQISGRWFVEMQLSAHIILLCV